MTKNTAPKPQKQLSERRAKAAALVAKNAERQKKQKIALYSGFGVLAVSIIVAVTLVILNSTANKLDVSETSPTALSTNGVIMTSPIDIVKGESYKLDGGEPAKTEDLLKDSEVPHIEIYLDYDCPHCADFEEAAAATLEAELASGTATVEYKPIVVIGSNLSISGANAAACVAEYAPERFLDAHNALFAQHGEQNVSVGKTIRALNIDGEAGENVESCVSSKVFSDWVQTASTYSTSLTDESGAPVVAGTPTILIDGMKYDLNPVELPTFLNYLKESGLSVEEALKNVKAPQG